MTALKIEVPKKEISELCSRYQVRELSAFGSLVRGDFRADSDIDLLVEFAPEAEISFFTLSQMGRELAEILHRPVDLVPKGGLKPKIRKEILETRKVIYAA